MNDLEKFETFGYVVVRDFLDATTVKTISMYMENKIRRGEWKESTDPASKFSYYSDPLIEVVLLNSLSCVSGITGKQLYPTYSYMRVYQPQETLKKHVDRPSCEISVTVNVGYKGAQSKIWMEYANYHPNSIELNPGDSVIYKGCDVKHWRETLESDQLNAQFMLHYVDINGPHSKFKFDGRSNLGFPTI